MARRRGHKMSTSIKEYVAGVTAYVYPGLGDPLPPGGAKVLLLTAGGVCTTGPWARNDLTSMAWSPLPSRSEYTYPSEDGVGKPGSGELLLLTKGGVCVFGPWTSDERYLGWARKPERNRAKEDLIAEARH